jgi:hypothetical protein
MNLDQILAHIISNHDDADIQMFARKMAAGELTVRKQLADLVCMQHAGSVPASMIYEISKWGVNDDLSLCPEIRAFA